MSTPTRSATRDSSFMKLMRVASMALDAYLVNSALCTSSLASDVGVSGHTARAWINLLEASYVVRLLPPWFASIGKRLVKSPKLYFCDSGLAAWLVGITDERQIPSHPLRGLLFENLIVMEFVKHAFHHGRAPALHYYRDSAGLEVDLVVEDGMPPGRVGLVEVKAGQTFHGDFLVALRRVEAALKIPVARRMLVFGGQGSHVRAAVEVVGMGD